MKIQQFYLQIKWRYNKMLRWKILNCSANNLYTNTVLDGSVILSICLWFCPFAIETTFPLSNFKAKHIFGILMERVKFWKPFGRGARGARIFYIFFCCRRPKFLFFYFYLIIFFNELFEQIKLYRHQYFQLPILKIFRVSLHLGIFGSSLGGWWRRPYGILIAGIWPLNRLIN